MSQHEEAATELLALADRDRSENWPLQTGEHKADILTAALVEATLAVAEQQRIANLIALAQFSEKRFGGYAGDAGATSLFTYPETESGNMIIRPEIRVALGL